MSKADAIRWPPELSFLSQTLSSTLAEIRREERVGQHLVSMLWECDTPDERDQTPVADMIEARKCLPWKSRARTLADGLQKCGRPEYAYAIHGILDSEGAARTQQEVVEDLLNYVDAMHDEMVSTAPAPAPAPQTERDEGVARATAEATPAVDGEIFGVVGVIGDPNRHAILTKLPAIHRKAYYSFRYAETKVTEHNGKLGIATRLEDQAAWDWLHENGIEGVAGTELEDYELPEFSTWSRYIRVVRKATGERKYTPRKGRSVSESTKSQFAINAQLADDVRNAPRDKDASANYA